MWVGFAGPSCSLEQGQKEGVGVCLGLHAAFSSTSSLKAQSVPLFSPLSAHLALPGPWGGSMWSRRRGIPLYYPSLCEVGSPVADIPMSPFFASIPELPRGRADLWV